MSILTDWRFVWSLNSKRTIHLRHHTWYSRNKMNQWCFHIRSKFWFFKKLTHLMPPQQNPILPTNNLAFGWTKFWWQFSAVGMVLKKCTPFDQVSQSLWDLFQYPLYSGKPPIPLKKLLVCPAKSSLIFRFLLFFQVYKPLLERFKALEDKITFLDWIFPGSLERLALPTVFLRTSSSSLLVCVYTCERG